MKIKNNIKFLIILFSSIVIAFILGNYYPIIKESFIIGCSTESKTFEYEGCSTKYQEIIYENNCRPCDGLVPCPSGFNKIEKISVLRCLCDGGKIEKAKEFAKKYLLGSDVDYKVRDTTRKSGYKYIREFMYEDEISQLCDLIPEQPYYQ